MVIRKFLQLNTQSSAKKLTKKVPIGYDQAKSVGLLFTIEDLVKHKAIKKFIKVLEDEGKQVQVLTFLPKGKENHEFLFDFIAENDFNFWGKLLNRTAIRFIENKFDFLLHLDRAQTDFIDNILSKSQAKCRVGILKTDRNEEPEIKYYEIIIHPDENETLENNLNEIHHYIKKILSNA